MTIARGSLNSSAKLHTFSVCTSTPATPSTTTSAASAATMDALVSLMKILKPGVSIRLIFFLFHSAAATRRGNGDLARDLFVVEVGDGVAFIDARQAIGRAARQTGTPPPGTSCRSVRGPPEPRSGYRWFRKLSLTLSSLNRIVKRGSYHTGPFRVRAVTARERLTSDAIRLRTHSCVPRRHSCRRFVGMRLRRKKDDKKIFAGRNVEAAVVSG